MKAIKIIGEKISWSFVGAVLALFFGIFGVYSILHEKKPNIVIEITNEVNVLDVRKPLEDLNISFMGEDIGKRNLNLRIFTVRVENNGDVDILQNNYDADDIWGVQVSNARIIEVRLVDSNSDYLMSKVNPHLINENEIEFNKVIFEKGKYFTAEILVLHLKEEQPEIIPVGKIAGIEKIIPFKSWLERGKKTFWEILSYGNVFFHLLRAFTYLSILALMGITVALIFAGFSSIKEKKLIKKRKEEIINVFGAKALESRDKKNLPFRYYVDYGYIPIKSINAVLRDKKILFEVLQRIQKYKNKEDYHKDFLAFRQEQLHERGKYVPVYRYNFLKKLIEEKVVKVRGKSEPEIDDNFKKTLEELLNYLETVKK